MQREARLRRQRDFDAVHHEGRSQTAGPLVVRARPNAVGHHRIGLSVGKRVGNAVTRNRVKRRLREAALRLHREGVIPLGGGAVDGGYDIVVIARASAAGVDYDELVRTLARLLRRALPRPS